MRFSLPSFRAASATRAALAAVVLSTTVIAVADEPTSASTINTPIVIGSLVLEAAPQPALLPEETVGYKTSVSAPVAEEPKSEAQDHSTASAAEGEQVAASIDSPAMKALIPAPAGFHPLWPTRGQITTHFGEVGPTSPRGHIGLDIAAPVGTPVYSVESGTVIKAQNSGDGYGILVIVAHDNGYETWYAHLSKADVQVGQHVERRELIGKMGSTGFSTGSHLHFEVRKGGTLVDPMNVLP